MSIAYDSEEIRHQVADLLQNPRLTTNVVIYGTVAIIKKIQQHLKLVFIQRKTRVIHATFARVGNIVTMHNIKLNQDAKQTQIFIDKTYIRTITFTTFRHYSAFRHYTASWMQVRSLITFKYVCNKQQYKLPYIIFATSDNNYNGQYIPTLYNRAYCKRCGNLIINKYAYIGSDYFHNVCVSERYSAYRTSDAAWDNYGDLLHTLTHFMILPHEDTQASFISIGKCGSYVLYDRKYEAYMYERGLITGDVLFISFQDSAEDGAPVEQDTSPFFLYLQDTNI